MTIDSPSRHEPVSDVDASPPPQTPRRAGRTAAAAIAALGVLLTGVAVGGFVFLDTEPALRPPAVDLSPDDVASAQDSVSSAKMLIDMMSATVNSGTAGIEKVTAAVEPTFASVDTASKAADQMVAGLAAAPSLSAAASTIEELGGTVSKSLTQAQSLASSAEDVDDLVTPIVSGLEHSTVPGADKTIEQLKSLQSASREIVGGVGDLGALRSELDKATAATGPAARQVDGAIDRARTAASQLKEGLDRLASAKADTQQAADDMSGGLGKLKTALATVSNNLSSADESLTSDDAAPAYVYDHANRIGRGIAAGAVTAVGLLVVGIALVLVVHRRRTQTGASTQN
ncbi:hypothetical protein [Gordonia humi]|uniref:Putative phage infection (PIP) family protein YhgE n=1 Tax=Gordonia humi TaxID=686429 RepID=A0A840EZI0_9ACTN|nr:hypothetical protein [Gordonia humi]MBB4135744.1 putative phage infection (PIP) family protein YhgE [Gordonia humi]